MASDTLTISGGIIDDTPIGDSTSSTGIFTDATTTDLVVIGSLNLPDSSVTDPMASDTLTISGGIIDDTPIGDSTSSTGIFTDATTTGKLSVSGTLKIGGGDAIAEHTSATTSIDFPSVASTTCYATNTDIAADGISVVASPEAVASGVNDKKLIWSTFASSSKAWIRICNPTDVDVQDAADQTWRLDVWQH